MDRLVFRNMHIKKSRYAECLNWFKDIYLRASVCVSVCPQTPPRRMDGIASNFGKS